MNTNQSYVVREFAELSDEELESVSGGLVVTYADGYRTLVIDDADGEWVEEVYNDLEGAIATARRRGYGDQVIHIDMDDYDQYAEWLRKSYRQH